MDRSVVVTYGFIIVTTMVMVVLIALATPFGMYIGDAMVSYAKGAEQDMEYQMNEGYKNNVELFESWMNNDTHIGYIEAGIYKEDETYNTADVYQPKHAKLLYDWRAIVHNNVMWTEDGTLKGSHTYITDENGNQIKDKSSMSEKLRGDIVLSSAALYVDDECFLNCEYITSIYMKETSLIGDRSFQNCVKLKSIFIDSTNMQIIGEEAFKGSGLKDIFFAGTREEFGKIKWAFVDKDGNSTKSNITVTIHCVDQEFEASI